MPRDLRHAIRVLVRARGWTVVVVLSLALGIGANTALFSLLTAMLLTTLPVKDPDTLVRLRYVGRNDMVTSSSDYGSSRPRPDGLNVRTTFSYRMYQQLVADNRTMTELTACAPIGRVNVIVDGQAEVADAFVTAGNYYQMLGVRARLGRTIVPDDDQPSASPVAVISSKYWHTRFTSDPAVVGKVVRISNVPVTIVGVIAPEFTGIQQPVGELPDVSLPLSAFSQLDTAGSGPPRVSQPTYWWLQVMGRLRPGATPEQVEGNLGGVFQSTARAGLDEYMKTLTDAQRSTTVNRSRKEVPRLLADSGSRGLYDVNTNELRSATILSVVVALVLLIVCANVANLLLSRAAERQKEISVRLSLGATRRRLVRQLLTESLLLAAAGGGLGILVGYWGRQLLPRPAAAVPLLDWRMLAFVAGITCVTGIAFGIAPALRATGGRLNDALKQNTRSVICSRSVLSRVLLVFQVAISLVLLVGAGLFLQTLRNLRHVDVGFNPQNLLLFRISPSMNRYDEQRARALYAQLLERIAAVPGVRSAALTNPALLAGSVNSTSIFVRGRVYAPDSRDNNINRLVVSPNFFEVMEIPLLLGRAFGPQDTETAPRVVIINDAAAKKYFPNENAVGQRFGGSVEDNAQFEVVGVLRDAKYNSVREAAPPTMYVPYPQTRVLSATIAVRTAAEPVAVTGAIRQAVRDSDPNLPMTDVSTQIEQVERRFQQERVFAQAYTLFGGLALLIAAIGLFGLMSYNVTRRTNEIGIRLALGAQKRDVLRLVMIDGLTLVVVGVVIGVAVAVATGHLVSTLLFGLPARDAMSIAGAVGVMLLVSLAAAYIPARRAARVDPLVALHDE